MKTFENILICTDLDGTLLRDNKSISEENLRAIEYFKSHGGMFTIVTGRIPCTVSQICDIVRPNVPYGCFNGSGLYDHDKQEYIWYTTLQPAAMEILHYIEKHMPTMGIQINTLDNVYFSTDNSAMERFRRLTSLPDRSLHYSCVNEPICKVIFSEDDPDAMTRVRSLLAAHPLADQFDFIRSSRTLYELLPKGHTKGTVLSRLAKHIDLPLSRTIAIGDYDNDIAMLQTAHLGIAVANASERARKVADHITVSNEEHAIARVIYDLESGRLKI